MYREQYGEYESDRLEDGANGFTRYLDKQNTSRVEIID